MAINVKTKYPDNADAPSLAYPTGSFRNDSAPESEDGTPLEKDWANDFLGARDAVILEGGVTPSGIPDTSESSDFLDALLQIISDNQTLPPFQSQAVWNAGSSTTESLISAVKLLTSIKTLTIGDGQTYQDVTASRAVGVNYTNTTGKTIYLSVCNIALQNSTVLSVYVGGIRVSQSSTGGSDSQGFSRQSIGFAIIPNGAVYRVESSRAIDEWVELR